MAPRRWCRVFLPVLAAGCTTFAAPPPVVTYGGPATAPKGGAELALGLGSGVAMFSSGHAGGHGWLTRWQPDAVAVERVFSQHNVRTVMGTAQVSAIAIVCAARRGLPVALHTPSEVKAAVTGNGRADKDQVGAMVTRLLRLPVPPSPADAADALALAICHLWRGAAAARLEAAVASASARRDT